MIKMRHVPALANRIIGAVRIAAAVAAALLMAAGAARAAGPDAADDPAAFLRDLSDRAIAVLADDGLSAKQRDRAFHELLTAGFDVGAIGRIVLGRHWRSATAEQRAEFQRLFEDFVVVTYARRLSVYAGETLEVGRALPAGGGDVTVASRVLRPGKPSVRVGWRLRRSEAGWRIIDVIIEGISMAVTQRAEFDSVIHRDGDRLDGLLAELREKIASAKGGA